jgi:8-amino-3,8-dideoxy-alpha-D-manno-octulosonate transaminase
MSAAAKHDLDARSSPIRSRRLPTEFPGSHAIDQEEEEAVLRVLRSRSLFRYYGADTQHETSHFEAEFAAFTGARHALAVTSGTAALHIALSALRVSPGQQVIIPAFMWVSVVAAVVNLGAIPVIAEVDDTFCLDPEDVRRKITPSTAGILFVHMCGVPGDVVSIVEIAREHHLFVVEDCAQCVGGTIDGQSVGTFGDIGTFSFQVNKNMTAGEAGAVITNDVSLYRRAIATHDIGYGRDEFDNLLLEDVASMGWGRGYRIDEIRAAILRVQLRKLPATLDHLRASKHRIQAGIADVPGLELRRVPKGAQDTGPFLITIWPDERLARQINQRLLWNGITCSAESSNRILADYGLHIYSNIPSLVGKIGTDGTGAPWTLDANRGSSFDYAHGACPRSDALFDRSQVLSIPSCLSLQDEQDIVDAFHDAAAYVQAR